VRVRRKVLFFSQEHDKNQLVVNFTLLMIIIQSVYVMAPCNEMDLKVQSHAGEQNVERDEKRKKQKKRREKES
jgi:hypothetical protein